VVLLTMVRIFILAVKVQFYQLSFKYF